MRQPAHGSPSAAPSGRVLQLAAGVSLALGLYIACAPGGGLTTPNATAPAQAVREPGGVTAQASPVSIRPTPTNLRPTPGNVGATPGNVGSSPGNVGSSPGNVGSSPGNIGSSPGNIGSSPGNIGSSPGGVGGSPSVPGTSPTPGPTPTATPSTPGPTPTPATCAEAGPVTFDAAVQLPSQIPFTTQGGNFQGPVITVNGSDYPNCTVQSIRVLVSATTGELADLGQDWVLRFDRPGTGPIGFDLIRVNGTGLSGTDLGPTPCGLVFENTGPDFLTTATPPYDGAFIAAGDAFTGQAGFSEYLGRGPGGDFGLYPAFLDTGSLQITCYRIEFVLQ
jgi:hypothetical protein